MAKNICSYKQSAKDKLADLKETAIVDETLIKHYEFILANFEKMQAELDDEIQVIQQKKDALLNQFVEAPEKLVELKKHLEEINRKRTDVKDEASGKTQKIAKLKILKAKLEKLTKEMEADGIDIEEMEEKIARDEMGID